MNINSIKIKLVILISLTIGIIFTSVIMASDLNTKYYLLLLVTLPLIYLSFRQNQRLNRAKLITNLRKKRGVAESRLRNFSELHAHFKKTIYVLVMIPGLRIVFPILIYIRMIFWAD